MIDIWIEAIEDTIKLHQMVIDGKYKNYTLARYSENGGDCPLCECAINIAEGENDVSYCDFCPWTTIQEPDSERDEPCDHPTLSISDPVQSISRLESWLKDERYEED